MLVVDPTRRLSAADVVNHEEVEKRRLGKQLQHPAAQPEEENDVELLATIKPPKSRYEVKKLSEKLGAMSAQVATSRSESKADLAQVHPHNTHRSFQPLTFPVYSATAGGR